MLAAMVTAGLAVWASGVQLAVNPAAYLPE